MWIDTGPGEPDALLGRVLGDFVLRERIGEGGYGAVYRCDQPALGRQAVVKVAHQRLDGHDPDAQRFWREAQLASRLDHPYAAHVYAFGIEPDDGLVWIAMELVGGVTLDRWLDGPAPRRADARRAMLVPFFERVAQVVHAAHERGIVHRDLKPANIMVLDQAGQLLPKLLDFGIAKLLEDLGPAAAPHPDWAPDAALTPRSVAIGSPSYMAPEQWTAGEVSAATDVYALGVVAYEAMVGTRPFRGETATQLRAAHLVDAAPPTGAPGLDRVFARALAKSPANRFGTAIDLVHALRAEVDAHMLARIRAAAREWDARGRSPGLVWRDDAAADLEAWVQRTNTALGELEMAFATASREIAGQASAARARRRLWVRRGMWIAAAAALAGAAGAVEIRRAVQTRLADAVQLEADREQGRAALLHGELAEAQAHLLEAHRLGDRTPGTEFMLARAMQPLHAELGRFPVAAGRAWAAVWAPDSARVAVADDRGARIWDVATHQLVATLPVGDTVYDIRYSADGVRLVTADGTGAVRLWSADGVPLRALHGRRAALRYYALALAPGLIAAVDTSGATADVWDSATGALLAEFDCDGSEWPAIGFSADDRWFAATGGNTVGVFDTGTWARAAVLPVRGIRALAWSPRGAGLLTGSSRGDASIWAPGGERLHHLREIGEPVDAVAWSPDGRLIAAGARDGAVQVFGTATGELQALSNQLHGKVIGLDFDTDSRAIAAAGATGVVAVSEADTGLSIALLDGPTGLVRSARFDPGSHRALGASTDGTARIWSAASPYRRWSSAPLAAGCGVAAGLVPDRRVVAVACKCHETLVIDTARDQFLGRLPAAVAPSTGAEPPLPAVTVTGDRAAIARGDHAEIYELPGPRLVGAVPHAAPVTAVAIDDDTGAVLSGDAGGTVMLTRGGGEPGLLLRAGSAVDALAWLPGDRVAVANAAGMLRVVGADGTTIAEVHVPMRVGLMRPSTDGSRLVAIQSTTTSEPPALWRIGDLDVRLLAGHTGHIFAARWLDGDRLLTTGGDGMARMWDSAGQLLQTYRGGASYLADAALSPDGILVVGGDNEGRLRYWDADSGRPLWITAAHRGAVVGLHFEGEDLVTRGFAGDVSRWRISEK